MKTKKKIKTIFIYDKKNICDIEIEIYSCLIVYFNKSVPCFISGLKLIGKDLLYICISACFTNINLLHLYNIGKLLEYIYAIV